jgi:hypothetical protein
MAADVESVDGYILVYRSRYEVMERHDTEELHGKDTKYRGAEMETVKPNAS